MLHMLQRLLLICIGGIAIASPSSPSLASVMSFTNREQLINGFGHLAWVETTRGVSNIFGAHDSNLKETLQLTNYTEDDGMEISLFGFHHTEKMYSVRHALMDTLVHFSRRPSDDSNPQHACTPPVGGFFAVAFAVGATPTLITQAPVVDVAFSRLLYTKRTDSASVAGGNLGESTYKATSVMMLQLTRSGDGTLGAPQRLFTTKQGSIQHMRWSPNGTVLAFVNSRGNRGFIGLYRFDSSLNASGALSWLSPSFDSDTWPHWSADGSMLAFRRDRNMVGKDGRDIRCVKHGYCGTAGPAYSIMVVDYNDATTTQRAARTLYTDHITGYPDGSAGYGVRDMIWHEHTLLFASETSGYVHVVSIDASKHGASATDLTPLPCDNQAYTLHGTELYVTHNCDMADSLGIAKVDIASFERSVVVEAGNHTVSGMASSGGHIAFMKSGLVYISTSTAKSTTLRLLLQTSNESIILTPDPPSSVFDSSQFVEPSLVTFAAPDGTTVHAQLFTPRSLPGSMRGPAVIFTHGGCQRQMYAAFHYGLDYAQLYAQNQYLTSLGFSVLSINYRGGPGYGVKFRAANGSGWQGASEYQDVLAGAKWLSAQPNIDASRIGIYGLSYGGLNTLQALTRNSDIFAAGVANAPVFNWITEKRFDGNSDPMDLIRQLNRGFHELSVGPRADLAGPEWLKQTQENLALAWESSPAGHLDKLTSPLLVIQGDEDANVDFGESVGLVAGLRGRGFSELETMVVPDERHGFVLFANELAAAERTMEFFVRRLGTQPAVSREGGSISTMI